MPKPRSTPRPTLHESAQRGLPRLIDAVPGSLILSDPDLKAAADWLTRYLAWYTSPAQVAKRKHRGDQIRKYMQDNKRTTP